MRYLIALILCALPSLAASPATCFAIHDIVTIADWNNAAYWSSSSGGSGSTCGASGGDTLSWRGYDGHTNAVSAAVPGCATCLDRIRVDGAAGKAYTVHVPATLGLAIGRAATAGQGILIGGTSTSVYGHLIVDDQALLVVIGNGSAGQTQTDLWGVIQVMPGGSYQQGGLSSYSYNNGRWYVGCGDQAKYGTPACAAIGNAGAWVTSSVAATLNFTAVTALPTLAAGDLVELDPIPQRTAYTYPYTLPASGIVPPPAPPILPLTNDTGDATNTCGSLAICEVPESTPLCVVAISGTSVSLGWPKGGTTANPYCTGAETALAVTDAGVGRLWLKKPAFLWGLPSNVTWATARSTTLSQLGTFDSIYSKHALDYAPISNAAHTGPGRPGDNSLAAFSGGNWGASACTIPRWWDVVANNCHVDYDLGLLTVKDWAHQFAGSVAYYGSNSPASPDFRDQFGIHTTTGTSAGNELLVQNVDIRYIYANSTGGAMQYVGYSNAANNRAVFVHNTVRMSSNVLREGGVLTTMGAPFEITENSTLGQNYAAIGGGSGAALVNAAGNGQYVDISHNYYKSQGLLLRGGEYAHAALKTHSYYTVTNNSLWTPSVAMAGIFNDNQWPGMLIQQNRVVMAGRTLGAFWPQYQWGLSTLETEDDAHPIVVRNNVIYGSLRLAALGSNTEFHHNFAVDFSHHPVSFTRQSPDYGSARNFSVHHNLLISNSVATELGRCIDAFQQVIFLDNVSVTNNTCLGMNVGVQFGSFGDSGSIQLGTRWTIKNNIFALNSATDGGGLRKRYAAVTSMTQGQFVDMGFNALQPAGGAVSMYVPVTAPNSNGIPNPEYNRHVRVVRSGVNYNTDATRAVLGAAIQNPSYSTNQTGGALKLVVTSLSDMTLAWAADGVTYGTAVQVNWAPAGAGSVYTVASTANPGTVYPYLSITTSAGPGYASPFTPTATPFVAHCIPGAGNCTGTNYPVQCPGARWAMMTGGSLAGSAYAFLGCYGTVGAATGTVYFATATTHPAIVATDTFAVLKSEVRLLDAGGVDYVDVGIDARYLPQTPGTYTDTGIALTMTDYCASGCGAASVVSGLPTTDVRNTSYLPLNPVARPWFGGSAEEAFTQAAFRPSGSGWKTASDTGSYIGALEPIAGNPAFPLIWAGW